jgi:hypothetical protein
VSTPRSVAHRCRGWAGQEIPAKIVEREEMAACGSYRSRELCLAYMSALAAGDPDAELRL